MLDFQTGGLVSVQSVGFSDRVLDFQTECVGFSYILAGFGTMGIVVSSMSDSITGQGVGVSSGDGSRWGCI